MSDKRIGRPKKKGPCMTSNLNVRLDRATYARLGEAAIAAGKGTRSQLVRSLIEDELERLQIAGDDEKMNLTNRNPQATP